MLIGNRVTLLLVLALPWNTVGPAQQAPPATQQSAKDASPDVAVASTPEPAPAPAALAEPQYINTFVALDADGKLNSLDHETATTLRSKGRALPWSASAASFVEFKPAHASIRLPATAQFVVRGRSSIDPSSIFELRSIKVAKDHREIVLAKSRATIVGGGSASNFDEGAVPIKFEDYATDSYRITPERPLPAGEYALSIRGAATELYCFGVN
jgi:hypothetical protein